jgi:hypothetical protein
MRTEPETPVRPSGDVMWMERVGDERGLRLGAWGLGSWAETWGLGLGAWVPAKSNADAAIAHATIEITRR